MNQFQAHITRSPSAMSSAWFEVDKQGLAKILERKGKEFALLELIQNAWDEPGVNNVIASLEYRGRNRAMLAVEDDAPEGFKDLSHAFTLFAESGKKTNPEQRGRFNLGEKLVLALCDEVTIQTTQGGLRFEGNHRHALRAKRTVGSRIECLIKMTAEECERVEAEAKKLIPPKSILTKFNGVQIDRRVPVDEFTATLRTEIAGEEGLLKRADRRTTIALHELKPGERATLYEMGIPVVETTDKWHYDIGQKIPLTLDRENVLPAFLNQVRLAVFNRTHDKLAANDVNSEWAEAAISSPDCAAEAVQSYLKTRFGEKRVSFDPSDSEANKIAVSKGYTVVHGGMMSAGAWKNARNANAISPAGQVTPGPKVWTGEDNPNAEIFRDWIPESKWTGGMREVADFATQMAEKLFEKHIAVKFCSTPHHLGAASYGPSGELVFNKFRLGADWFERGITQDVVQLLIHEFGHEFSSDHLSSEYHEALCRLGAKLFILTERGGF
jgi:hypothetical protein